MTRAVPTLMATAMAVTLTAQSPPANAVLFSDITRAAGVTFTHHAAPEKKYIVESMSGGVALFDFDNDGLLDIYFVDSLTVDTVGNPKAARSALYRNLGKNQFEDVTDAAGVGHPGWGMGVCTADFDGDGWEDIYVTALGGNKLYRNNHDKTFADVTARAGVAVGGWSTGCGFGDYDRDGDLDLFVTPLREDRPRRTCRSSARTRPASIAASRSSAARAACPGESDLSCRNEGNGRFTDVSQKAGVSDPKEYYGLGIAWFDCNEDGWPDLYVANDSTGELPVPESEGRHLQRSRHSRWAWPSAKTAPSRAAWASPSPTTTTQDDSVSG